MRPQSSSMMNRIATEVVRQRARQAGTRIRTSHILSIHSQQYGAISYYHHHRHYNCSVLFFLYVPFSVPNNPRTSSETFSLGKRHHVSGDGAQEVRVLLCRYLLRPSRQVCFHQDGRSTSPALDACMFSMIFLPGSRLQRVHHCITRIATAFLNG